MQRPNQTVLLGSGVGRPASWLVLSGGIVSRLSLAYIVTPKPICSRLLIHRVICAVVLARFTAGNNIEAKTAETNATVDIIIDIADVKHLERIISGVRKIAGVKDVQRVQKV